MTKIIGLALSVSVSLCICLTGCATGSKSTLPVGEVKITYFAIAEGQTFKQTVTTYLGLVSQKWAKHYGRRLNEPFETVVSPAVKVVPDNILDELITLIKESKFYAVRSASPDQFNTEKIQDKTFRGKILTVEIDGISRAVSLDAYADNTEMQSLLQIKQAIYLTFNVVDDPSVRIELGDWHDTLKPPSPEESKEPEK